MRETDGDITIYESLLNLYYDDNARSFLNKETVIVVERYLEYCKAKDIVDNTRIAETMEIVYNTQNKIPKYELKQMLALSGSSLYRFRIKLVHSFQKYIKDKLER